YGRADGMLPTLHSTSVRNMARTAVALLRSALNLPFGETSRYAGSFDSNRVSQVTSFFVPSENVAIAVSCTSSPGLSTFSDGVSSSLLILGSFLSGPGKPALIQPSSRLY